MIATLILTLVVKITIATLILTLVVKITIAIKYQIKLTRNKLGFFESHLSQKFILINSISIRESLECPICKSKMVEQQYNILSESFYDVILFITSNACCMMPSSVSEPIINKIASIA